MTFHKLEDEGSQSVCLTLSLQLLCVCEVTAMLYSLRLVHVYQLLREDMLFLSLEVCLLLRDQLKGVWLEHWDSIGTV